MSMSLRLVNTARNDLDVRQERTALLRSQPVLCSNLGQHRHLCITIRDGCSLEPRSGLRGSGFQCHLGEISARALIAGVGAKGHYDLHSLRITQPFGTARWAGELRISTRSDDASARQFACVELLNPNTGHQGGIGRPL